MDTEPTLVVEVMGLRVWCWKCGAQTRAIAAVRVPTGSPDGYVVPYTPEIGAELSTRLSNRTLHEAGWGPLLPRRRQGSPVPVVRNCCTVCGIVQGETPLSDELQGYWQDLADGLDDMDDAIQTMRVRVPQSAVERWVAPVTAATWREAWV